MSCRSRRARDSNAPRLPPVFSGNQVIEQRAHDTEIAFTSHESEGEWEYVSPMAGMTFSIGKELFGAFVVRSGILAVGEVWIEAVLLPIALDSEII